MVLTFIGGVEIGDGIEGSDDWVLYCSSARITAVLDNRIKRQVEVIEAGWENWVLIAEPVKKYGFVGVRVYRDNLWLRRGNGGHRDCLSLQSS